MLDIQCCQRIMDKCKDQGVQEKQQWRCMTELDSYNSSTRLVNSCLSGTDGGNGCSL